MFPNVLQSVLRFSDTIKFKIVTKSVVDFEVSESQAADVEFYGVLEPMPMPQQLIIEAKGFENWKYWTLWTPKELNLDDVVVDEQALKYRVMQKKDWRRGGYFEYVLTEQHQL